MQKAYPVIDLAATGRNILSLRQKKGLTVRDMQKWFNFEEPRAIYKWQSGQSLPSVDNLYALSVLLDIPIEEILITKKLSVTEPQESPAAQVFYIAKQKNMKGTISTSTKANSCTCAYILQPAFI